MDLKDDKSRVHFTPRRIYITHDIFRLEHCNVWYPDTHGGTAPFAVSRLLRSEPGFDPSSKAEPIGGVRLGRDSAASSARDESASAPNRRATSTGSSRVYRCRDRSSLCPVNCPMIGPEMFCFTMLVVTGGRRCQWPLLVGCNTPVRALSRSQCAQSNIFRSRGPARGRTPLRPPVLHVASR